MIELPKELWILIKEYQIDQKKHHSIKYKNVIRKINYSFGPRITINCLSFPPPKNWEYKGWGKETLFDTTPTIHIQYRNVDLKLELTAIIHHRKKCSKWASRFPPFYVSACYGWKNWKREEDCRKLSV